MSGTETTTTGQRTQQTVQQQRQYNTGDRRVAKTASNCVQTNNMTG